MPVQDNQMLSQLSAVFVKIRSIVSRLVYSLMSHSSLTTVKGNGKDFNFSHNFVKCV